MGIRTTTFGSTRLSCTRASSRRRRRRPVPRRGTTLKRRLPDLSRSAKANASHGFPTRDCGIRAVTLSRIISTNARPSATTIPIAWPTRSTATTTTTFAFGMRQGGTSTRTLDRGPSTAPHAITTRTRKRAPNTVQDTLQFATTRRRRGATQRRSSCPTRRRRAARATITRRRATCPQASTHPTRSGWRSTPTMPHFSRVNRATRWSRRARCAAPKHRPEPATLYTRAWETSATAGPVAPP